MSKRDDIVANALWGVDNEPDIHYSQGPQRLVAIGMPRSLPLYTDCSGFYTLCCNWAGVPDPNGLNYNGYGFTGTLLQYMEEIPLEQACRGDAIIYGPGTGDHVVLIVSDEGTDNPWVVSHGQERGPIKLRHLDEASSHRAPVRVLRLAGADEEAGGLQMDPDVQAALDAIHHEAETARGEAAAAHMLIQQLSDHFLGDNNVEGKVVHIEKMLGSDIDVDNQSVSVLSAIVAAVNQLKDDLNALRNVQVGPPANAAQP